MGLKKRIPPFVQNGVGFFLCAILVLFIPTHVTTAYGNDDETETLGFVEIEDVYAAAKHLQRLQEAPSSISIVTDEDIKRYGHRHLTDVVNSVGGFYTYSDKNYDYIGVRGFARLGDYGNRVLQLVDGHTLNDNIYGSFFLGHSFGVDMDLVKRIEFIRGPGSALYGSNAVFGMVNVIPKQGRDINGLQTKIEGGSFNGYSGGMTFGQAYGEDVDLLISASFLNSRGQDLHYPEFNNPAAADGWFRDGDGERGRKFLLKATVHELSFLTNIGWREKNIPTGAYGTIFGDNRSQTMDERLFAELKWDHPLSADARLKSRVYYDRYRFEGAYPYDYPPITMNKDQVLGQWVGGEVHYDRKVASHHFLVGSEVAYHMDARQKNYDEAPMNVYLDDNHTFTNWSVYGQDEWKIARRLRFTGGLRFDQYSTFGKSLSPRAGFIVTTSDTQTIKLLYGQAFRAPNVYELYYKSNTGTSVYRDNPDLKPENVQTYEIVLEQEVTSVLKMTVSGFHYEAKDLINQQTNTDGSLQFFNVSKIKSDGLEIGMEVHWPGWLKGHASYSFQDTRDERTGQWLANSPRHLVKAGLRIPLYKNMLFLGGLFRYMGNRHDRDGGDVGDAAVTDIILSAERKGFTVTAGAYNIFDTLSADPVSVDHTQRMIRQNGRNFWLKIGYAF